MSFATLGDSMLTRRSFFILSTAFLMTATEAEWSWAADEATALLNEIRAENGRGPLESDKQLESMAQDQAQRMAEAGKVAHTVGFGNDFVTRLRRFGIRGAAGENLCAGRSDIASAYRAWMNSPGHRSNMLHPDFHRFGLAKASSSKRPNYLYWAIEFQR